MEVLVTVLLLSALGLALWSGMSAAVRLGRRVVGEAVAAARLSQLDRVLRREALRVRTPYWATGPRAESGPDSLRVSWLDGQPSGTLLLERRGSLLVVRSDGPPAVFGPFANLEFDVFRGGTDHPQGLRVAVNAAGDAGDDPVVLVVPFGGSPMPAGGAP
jgi:hypothetical protein